LLIDELVIRGLPPTGELEELCQWLPQELVPEDKLKLHLDKLMHCNALEACLIALLPYCTRFRAFCIVKIGLASSF